MCLYGTNLNFIRNMVPRCSWQAFGGYVLLSVCLGDLCMTLTSIHPHTSVHPSYICMLTIPLYIPIHLYTPECYIPHTPPNMSAWSQYICTHPYIHIPHTSLCFHTYVHPPHICTPSIYLYALNTSPTCLYALYICAPIHLCMYKI